MSDTVRVYLSDDYYRGAQFNTLPQTYWSERNVFDVPPEQVALWEEAEQAWADAQAEMHMLMDARHAQRRAVQEERDRREAEYRQREEQRRAEIRAQLYGGRKR